MVNVLFVCLGNICRSPLAEGIFKKLVKERGLDSFITIDSAGTSNWHINDPPDIRTVEIAEKHGIDLDHLGQQISDKDLEKYDYVIAMDSENYENIQKLKYDPALQKAEVILMRDFDSQRSGADIPDPYYGGEDGFQLVYDLLEESLQNFLDHIVAKHK